ncbi:N-acetylmuramate/N-acetylglucosamine kinase [BD1-7 clade bacterium]|uniref:N-acetylmuramate/N-acetylglucosamine kinase n=1 Tax=BD1-7 clade bacterium TaxID=2029982 RepID=A0A5S9QWC1_9GAMM|nr:N-acetylmuramate/N-acetylglucosamine kinase [BD1-7 clade bacterium]
MNSTDNEYRVLQSWVADQLHTDITHLHWQPLPGDASFRRYFRCNVNEQAYIVALAPPETEKNTEFVAVAELLAAGNIAAPKVFAVDLEYGYLLQSDLGHTLLADVLDDDSVDHWYRQAMAVLLDCQHLPEADVAKLGAYDRDALALELSYFRVWFVEALLGYNVSDDESAMLDEMFDWVLTNNLSQPTGFVHRDYHSRNIMVVESGLAVIDFQDALSGPVTYDLVSLLRDCYVQWPAAKVDAWVADFYRQLAAREPEKMANVTLAAFKTHVDLMGLQRHIKVLGVFARLAIRDNKPGYLDDLPLVIHYVRSVVSDYPQAAEFLAWFDRALLPLAKQQDWGAAL